jgi:hypothetical protein
MHKIKYILLIVLCAGLIGSAINVSAQTGGSRVLVAGKKSLRESEVEKLIEFYEWAMDATFTADERARFQTFTINEFRNDPNTSRSTIDDIVQTMPRILAAAVDVQNETKKNFLDVFLPEARRNSDENSQMLVGIYDRAHGGKRNSGENAANNRDVVTGGNQMKTAANNQGGNAGNLSGKWHRSTGSGSRDYTGKTQYKAGEDFYFEFFPDGTVTYTSQLDVLTIMQCVIKGENKARGTYSVAGNSLTINLGAMTAAQTHSCEKKENYNKTLEPTSTTVKFEVKKMESLFRPDNPTILCFDGASDSDCYEKVKQ